MAEQAKGEAEEGKGGGKSKLMLIGMLINTLLVLGLGGYLLFAPRTPSPAEAPGAAPGSADPVPAEEGKVLPQADLGEFLVNLNELAGDRYVKLKVTVELSGPELESELQERKVQIRDAAISYLSSLRLSDTLGHEGKEEMRRGLRSRLNGLLRKGQIEALYFTDFMVQ